MLQRIAGMRLQEYHAAKDRAVRATAPFLAALATVATLAPPAEATTFTYALEVPDGREAAFEMAIPVEHDGTLVVEAKWSGARVLSFKLHGPGDDGTLVRRSGPSPQTLKFEIRGQEGLDRGPWKLAIRALPAGGEIKGHVKVSVPEPAPPVEETPASAKPQAPPSPAMPDWAAPKSVPGGASRLIADLFGRVEAFRARITLTEGGFAPDGCGWQADLLHDLAAWRDALESGKTPMGADARRILERTARAVRDVEELRGATDPIRAGPPPENSLRRRAWLRVRQQELRPLEAELDALAAGLRRGPAGGLEEKTWPQRFVACLMACERYFDERVPLGEEATNAAVAEAQWDAFLLAGAALDGVVAASAVSP